MSFSELTKRAVPVLTWIAMSCSVSASAKDTVRVGDRIGILAPAFTETLDPEMLGEQKTGPLARLEMLTGRVQAIESGMLTLRVDGADLLVPIDELERVHIWSQGSYAFPMGALGAIAGAFIGGSIGGTREPPQDCTFLCPTEDLYTLEGAFLGVLIGGALGGLLGSTVARDNWTEASLSGLRASLAMDGPGSVQLVCSTSF